MDKRIRIWVFSCVAPLMHANSVLANLQRLFKARIRRTEIVTLHGNAQLYIEFEVELDAEDEADINFLCLLEEELGDDLFIY